MRKDFKYILKKQKMKMLEMVQRSLFFLTLSLPTSCTISGLKSALSGLQNGTVSSLTANLLSAFFAFWWKSVHTLMRKPKREGWTISNFALLLVLKWLVASGRVKHTWEKTHLWVGLVCNAAGPQRSRRENYTPENWWGAEGGGVLLCAKKRLGLETSYVFIPQRERIPGQPCMLTSEASHLPCLALLRWAMQSGSWRTHREIALKSSTF